MVFERPQHAHFERGHHDYERDRPCEHLVGLYEVGAKLSIPLKFMPKGYGFWNVHAGYKYMHFVDENLQGMNQFNSPGKSTEEIHQVYGGISVFF